MRCLPVQALAVPGRALPRRAFPTIAASRLAARRRAAPLLDLSQNRGFVPRKDFLKCGDLQNARLYVHVKPTLSGTFTDIAMWIFCPFNRPVTLKIRIKNIPFENWLLIKKNILL
ncbi:uncharacterized protein LOC107634430 [Arachis ipaensis]|uniref:uncharacterized protein LOC107634430 n=1 Tax=Arachis ipaensis TaxID=130454 RepID=UPI0007AF1586|nr:uncharacterized protein LOC107634430 [Arachis ipaensis]XP_025644571.1 uncharacterized protein LOC112738362 [Arachis hypogaea]